MSWRVAAGVTAVVLVIAYAGLSGLWVATGSSWYASLPRPAWQPPDPVFGLAWTYNYLALTVVGIVMAVQAPAARAWSYVAVFAVTIVAAIAWSWLFFHPHALVGAAISLTVCAIMTLALVVLAFAQAWWCGALLLPYQAWLAIATSLSWGYVVLTK